MNIKEHPLQGRLKALLSQCHNYKALTNAIKQERDRSCFELDRLYWCFCLAQLRQNRQAIKDLLTYNQEQARLVYRYSHKPKHDKYPPQYRDRWGENSIYLNGVKPLPH